MQEAIQQKKTLDVVNPSRLGSGKQSVEEFYGAEDPGEGLVLGSDDVSS
jgi:hypothetical protein